MPGKIDNCVCPICEKEYLGNPQTDQVCFACWWEQNKVKIPVAEEEQKEGAGGWNYYAKPNTIRAMSDADWHEYIGNCPRTPFLGSVYRTVLHNSASPPLNGIQVVVGFATYHIQHNGWADIGYSAVVTPDGQWYLGRNWTYQGAHAHASGNSGSLGWCMVGNFTGALPTIAQIQSYRNLTAITKQYLPIRISTGHRWVDDHPTSCPGMSVSLEMIESWATAGPVSGPIPIERREEEMYPIIPNATHYFADVWTKKYSHWLHIQNRENTAANVILNIQEAGQVTKDLPGFQVPANGYWKQDLNNILKGHGDPESCCLTVKSTVKVIAYIREW